MATNDASLSAQVSALANQSAQLSAATVFYTVEHAGDTPPPH
jgi:hypothetical protein